MSKETIQKIDYSAKHCGDLAYRFALNAEYTNALRFAFKEYEISGECFKSCCQISDIYEKMGLSALAINWSFRMLEAECDGEMLPEIYEGLSLNYYDLGEEDVSTYYYKCMLAEDEEMVYSDGAAELAELLEKERPNALKFVHPPQLADYSEHISTAARALKHGDCKRAISILKKVAKGSKQYEEAQEMVSVAHLLQGEAERAESVCKLLLLDYPDNVRAKATLAAAYLEQGKSEESREIAETLAKAETNDVDDLYKIATVCCENGLHAEAYEKFCALEDYVPYECKMMYFKAVSAYKSGKTDAAERILYDLCTVHPHAEVARYYLDAIRAYADGVGQKPDLSYFYRVPQEAREARLKQLTKLCKCTNAEKELYRGAEETTRCLYWCFDEMDGTDHDLQKNAIQAAVHLDERKFLRDIFFNIEVLDGMKLEALRALYERNEEECFGVVLGHVYRKVTLRAIQIGRKKRKSFLKAYANVASKFSLFSEKNGEMIKKAAEMLYHAFETYDGMELIDDTNACACAIFMESDLKDFQTDEDLLNVIKLFDADTTNVFASLAVLLQAKTDEAGESKTTEAKDEVDGF